MPSATAITQTGLQALVYECWHVPPRLRKRLLHALLHARCERAQTLRFQSALVGHSDLDSVFLRILTPQFTVAMIEDFHVLGLFSRQEATQIEDAILHVVNKDGLWKSYEELHYE
jgi:hypothetical protein